VPPPSRQTWAAIAGTALRFSKAWSSASSEKSHKHDFVRAFLAVFGAPAGAGEFERTIKTADGRANFIDFVWDSRIAIEIKTHGKDLRAAFEQLSGYMSLMPPDKVPDLWMVSDFRTIRIRHISQGQEVSFPTSKLKKHIRHFAALAGLETEAIRTDKESVNVQAAGKMADLHEALKGHGYSGHDLQVFVARILFCLFADDTGIFPQDSFFQYVNESKDDGSDLSARLSQLFQDLDKPIESRSRNPYLSDTLKQSDFQHINGGLFNEKLDLAAFDVKMRRTLLDCLTFDWGQISPAIFGSMFQGAMEGVERREIGAHYTSEENILKLIDPLFMDDLRQEFQKAKKSPKTLADFHNRLSRLGFLDPACGCGNFLIVAYRELRRLEHDVIREEFRRSGTAGHRLVNLESHIAVTVEQFAGIEMLPWPCQLAMTGMWLMDHLMNMEASDEFGDYYARLPLTKGATIIEGNALRVDWMADVALNHEWMHRQSYILGNPPFVGARLMNKGQKDDMAHVFGKDTKGVGSLDYVTAWYRKAADFIAWNTSTRAAFVSTNSIAQGEQPAILWRPLIERGLHINFAVPTFRWTNEAKGRAAVHCVIVGFSRQRTEPSINPYLVEGPTAFIERRSKPLCDAPEMVFGSMPNDGGALIIEENEMAEFLRQEPLAKPYIRRFVGAEEFINNGERWCLWLVDVKPADLRKMPKVMGRVEACKRHRSESKREGTNRLADTPALFGENRHPDAEYILVPGVSSEHRRYIPIGFMPKDAVASNATLIIPGASLWHFGVLTSGVHMSWARAVCGRLEMRYRYSKDIVYNCFPWPEATDKQRADIERLAQAVLDARAAHPDSSLADLYDPLTMPRNLLAAHRALDAAVMKLYGYTKGTTEAEIVADLMGRYVGLASCQ